MATCSLFRIATVSTIIIRKRVSSRKLISRESPFPIL
jgi:hypothetical protein